MSCLTRALQEIAKIHPEDPIDYLAEYCFKQIRLSSAQAETGQQSISGQAGPQKTKQIIVPGEEAKQAELKPQTLAQIQARIQSKEALEKRKIGSQN
ncbi:MAG: hypothetical protein EZS28_033000 [Streblomastix strix]|uniref:RIIa domain-containing protein n=1 Tax=Streblomastix strix TaxID=222440 RepID=A0A5J4UMF2_9EUKA|nr:MAG: hypothetical protein EZS28_033000 [Streblomastix strix]